MNNIDDTVKKPVLLRLVLPPESRFGACKIQTKFLLTGFI